MVHAARVYTVPWPVVEEAIASGAASLKRDEITPYPATTAHRTDAHPRDTGMTTRDECPTLRPCNRAACRYHTGNLVRVVRARRGRRRPHTLHEVAAVMGDVRRAHPADRGQRALVTAASLR